MKRPTLIFLILLALAAGLYTYMQQPNNVVATTLAGTAQPSQAVSEFLVGPLAPAFAKIQIETTDGRRLTFEAVGATWLLREGNSDPVPADAPQTESGAGALRDAEILRHLEHGANPADYGLDKPSHAISILYADGSELHFRLGSPTVTGSGYYAQLTDGEIVIIGATSVEKLLRLLTTPPYLFTPTPTAAETATPVP